MTTKTNQSWGGRFNEPTDEFVKIFGASVFFDIPTYKPHNQLALDTT